jgi:DNA-binding FadR family transcriptional regulator
VSEVLQRVQRRTVTDLIIDQLAELIETGQLQAGDRVPTENELSIQLGASRGSVREALKALQVIGIVERSNDGTVVTADAAIKLLSRSLSVEHQQRELEIGHLFRARRILESEIAALAAEQVEPVALDELRGLCREMETCRGDFETYFSLDMRFHNLICGIAGNPVLSQMWSVIHGLLDFGRSEIRTVEGIQEYSNSNHTRLLTAFERKDAPAARALVYESLERIETLLLENLKSRQEARPHAHEAVKEQ